MGEDLRNYCLHLIEGVPHEVYIMALIIFCTGSIISLGLKGWQKGFRFSTVLLLLEYMFLLYGSTVFFRETMAGRQYDFTPFWSYSVERLIPENIMNVVVFVPIGLLIGILVSKVTQISKNSRMGWLVAFCVGMGSSLGIETMQFLSKKGFAEIDDVIHNTLGCFIGYIIYLIIIKVWNWAVRYRMHLLDKNGFTIDCYK